VAAAPAGRERGGAGGGRSAGAGHGRRVGQVPELVSIDEIRAAAASLDGVALRTSLVPYPRLEPPLLLKPESLQPTGSFKVRGAYTAISALPAQERRRGVVAHSSGNHAQAVAYAAALLRVPATVVIPANAPSLKIAAARALGANVVISQPGLPARLAATDELVARHGYTVIPPFDDRKVIAGQGTVGLEIATDCPDADLVLCPISGGGLISGIAAAINALSPATRIIGVEPELAADARDSLRQRRRVAWSSADTQRTIADALRVEQIGELPLQHMLSYVHDIVTVSEQEIREAVRRLAVEARLVAEPGGAVAVAAGLFRAHELPAARLRVAVLSGGNVDPGLLAEILGQEPAGREHQAGHDAARDEGAPARGSPPRADPRRGSTGTR
jgi:threonine dehydratase